MKRYLIALVAFLVLVSPLSAELITKNKVIFWVTNRGQNGTMKITAVNGNYFEAEMTNQKKVKVKFYGAIIDSPQGKDKILVLINAGKTKEIWEGALPAYSDRVEGKVTAGSVKYTFVIKEKLSGGA